MIHTMLRHCPVCHEELTITKLSCPACDTVIEGRFLPGAFSQLNQEQLAFIETFVRCEGKINRMEVEMGLSYPTIRNRLHDVIRALGYEPGEPETPIDISEEERRGILEKLDRGEISSEEAMKYFQEGE